MTARSSLNRPESVSPVQSSGTVWTGLHEVPSDWRGCAVTMGVFDGFHRGHAALVRRVRERAARHGLPSVLLTFDPHPLTVTRPERAPRYLTSLEERVRLAHDLGIDAVLVLPFTPVLAGMVADEFADRVLGHTLGARAVVVGENFRFGRGGGGDTTLLGRAGMRLGFTVDAVPLVAHDGRTCSSTVIRSRLAAGDLKGVEELLGRPWRTAISAPPEPPGGTASRVPATDSVAQYEESRVRHRRDAGGRRRRDLPEDGTATAARSGSTNACDQQEAERSGVTMPFTHAGLDVEPVPPTERGR
ncbi:hypothetical protein [Streptomyces sp. NPDC006510]|uniref:hypothetical protein n=1 Tax=Streptomyces sp. NPDC006510 TaxID=3155600 RepID=UPI0033A22D85